MWEGRDVGGGGERWGHSEEKGGGWMQRGCSSSVVSDYSTWVGM